MKLPVAFEEKMKRLLNEEYEAYLASYDLPKYQGLRVNTLKLGLDEWDKINPFTSLKTVPWCKEGFYYDAHEKPAKHPYYFAGLYYIQEPSAMSPGAYLPIEPGDRILDMCAAPGGKSTQLAARMQQEGILVSNDISASRVKALLKNLENFGNRTSIVTSENSERLASKWPGYFDKILIDAPCSGEGMFRKNETAIKSWDTHGIEHCAHLQRIILEDAVTLLKPDGMILYSTCTFSPEENEGMIDEFLKKHPDFKVVPLEPVGGIQHGRPEFMDSNPELRGALRLWPHHLEGEGHFVCLLQRTGGEAGKCPVYGKQKRLKDYPDALAFMKQYTHLNEDMPVTEISGKLYSVPEGAPDLKGIRVIRGGLLLGELKNKRFEPSHVLALAYDQSMFKQTIHWSLEDEEVTRYLKGETVLCDKPKGYYVVCVDGYPLGWVKAQNGMLKNQYPPSWRLC
ncbi:MAG: NOL1/NOP2/sun family putative RNA methylase [Cellulosilyticum sp.]|nr:NOL1/NOP2/sun family putative RNA methylase [Cellulosilyticum sp.]